MYPIGAFHEKISILKIFAIHKIYLIFFWANILHRHIHIIFPSHNVNEINAYGCMVWCDGILLSLLYISYILNIKTRHKLQFMVNSDQN